MGCILKLEQTLPMNLILCKKKKSPAGKNNLPEIMQKLISKSGLEFRSTGPPLSIHIHQRQLFSSVLPKQ